MNAPSSCQHRGSMIAQKQQHTAVVSIPIVRLSHTETGRDEKQPKAHNNQLHKQPVAQTTSRTTHSNRTHKSFPAFLRKELKTDNNG
eukprot:1194407-Ditylum_brightwellii.AAC.1